MTGQCGYLEGATAPVGSEAHGTPGDVLNRHIWQAFLWRRGKDHGAPIPELWML